MKAKDQGGRGYRPFWLMPQIPIDTLARGEPHWPPTGPWTLFENHGSEGIVTQYARSGIQESLREKERAAKSRFLGTEVPRNDTNIKSPEVVFRSFVSASSSL
jgi:hypothetical protein